MKKIISCLFLTLVNISSFAQTDWGTPVVYDFNQSDIATHDATWKNGWMWLESWSAFGGGSGNIPTPVKLFPNMSMAYYDTTSVGTGTVSANPNIEYHNTGGRTFVRLKTIPTTSANNKPYPSELPNLTRPYTTAVMWHTSGINFGYGKYEICCKFPKDKAVGNCGLWTFHGDGEIDIAELVNDNTYPLAGDIPTPSFSLHGWNTNDTFDPHFNIREYANYINPKPDVTADFHIYTFEWTEKYMKLSFDNKQIFFIERSQANYFPSTQMALILSNGLMNYYSPNPTNNNELDFDIDYIKIYPVASCTSKVLCDNDLTQNVSGYNIDLAVPDVNINLDPNYEVNNQIYACKNTDEANQNLIVYPSGYNEAACEDISCPKTVTNTNKLFATAVNHVVMWPGFSANGQGSTTKVFEATINEYACNPEGQRMNNASLNQIPISELKSLHANIFPNPSNGLFNIEVGEEGFFQVEIVDVTGRKFLVDNFSDKNYNLDLNDFQNGLYLIIITEINTGNKSITRIIKQ